MDPIVLILIGAIALVVVYFVFIRKKPEAALPEAEKPKEKPLAEAKPKEAAKQEPAKAAKAEPKPAKIEAPREAPTKKEPAVAKPVSEPPPSLKAAAKEVPAPPKPPLPERGAPARPSAEPLQKRAKDVDGLRRGLAKARESEGFFGRLKSLFTGRKEIDPQLVDQMEEILLTSDVGVKTTSALVESIRDDLSKGDLKDEARVWAALRERTQSILEVPGGGGLALTTAPTVVMVVGVNGVGKTTTIGKLATRLSQQGKKVVLAAGDTFRAAAVQQLTVWAKRAGCEVVTGAEGANAGAVIFDAIQKAKDIGADVVLADTAGRLHTKTNLMEELKKIAKTMNKAMEGSPHETLLVLDSTNGQNAIQQAALFKEALPLTGLVLTKLDGTAKGGVILGICAEHQVPVRYIGVGERAEDLRDFQADEFVEALLGGGSEAAERAA
ncbi:MAG: signal recognition particle-docking protein FtsY [Polyangiaceae bacterium]|nr:signal recognition particle-docking protein FtsY [Polyangiaceae bacterium]